jgi:hypothetical protein
MLEALDCCRSSVRISTDGSVLPKLPIVTIGYRGFASHATSWITLGVIMASELVILHARTARTQMHVKNNRRCCQRLAADLSLRSAHVAGRRLVGPYHCFGWASCHSEAQLAIANIPQEVTKICHSAFASYGFFSQTLW